MNSSYKDQYSSCLSTQLLIMTREDSWAIKKCEYCDKDLHIRKSDKKRFCNKSCSNSWQHANGVRKIGFDISRGNYDKWIEKYGKEKADELDSNYRKNMSSAIRRADMSHQHEVARKMMVERNKSTKGKKLEEIHGVEKAAEIRKKLSDATKGSKNPAYGKSYDKGGRSVKGHYKGRFFRSLFEYSFIKHLESLGRSIHNDIDYECFLIPYLDEGIQRTYKIDFYDKIDNIAYEVKPRYIFNVPKYFQIQSKKWNAAREFFSNRNIRFEIVTEEHFNKISLQHFKRKFR